MSRGLSLQGSYVWSKSLANGPTNSQHQRWPADHAAQPGHRQSALGLRSHVTPSRRTTSTSCPSVRGKRFLGNPRRPRQGARRLGDRGRDSRPARYPLLPERARHVQPGDQQHRRGAPQHDRLRPAADGQHPQDHRHRRKGHRLLPAAIAHQQHHGGVQYRRLHTGPAGSQRAVHRTGRRRSARMARLPIPELEPLLR